MAKNSLFLALIAPLLFFFISPPQVEGKLQSEYTQNLAITTGSWSSVVNSYNSPAANSPYVITWTGSTRKQYALIALINNGAFSIGNSQISYNSVKTNGDITNPPTMTFELCSGTWDPTAFTCSGNITLVGTGTGGVVDVNAPVNPGGRVIIRLTNLRDSSANYITTLNALTSRSGILSAQVYNS